MYVWTELSLSVFCMRVFVLIIMCLYMRVYERASVCVPPGEEA